MVYPSSKRRECRFSHQKLKAEEMEGRRTGAGQPTDGHVRGHETLCKILLKRLDYCRIGIVWLASAVKCRYGRESPGRILRGSRQVGISYRSKIGIIYSLARPEVGWTSKQTLPTSSELFWVE